MKQFVFLLLFLAPTAAANTPPEVTHLYAQQRLNSQFVDITYSVVDPDQEPLTISVYLLDGSGVMIMKCTSLSGAVDDGVVPGSNKHITWDAGAGFSDQYGSDYTLRVVANDGIAPGCFVAIPPGTFMMGSPTTEPGRQSDEAQHQVTLTHGFYMQATEVTNQQYRDMAQWAYDHGYVTVAGNNLCDNVDGSAQILKGLGTDGHYEITFIAGVFDCINPTHPVMDVNWYGSVAYCDWLSLTQGLPRAYSHSTWQCNAGNPYTATGYRLPTEAEWEYACRAGTQTPFSTGSCLNARTEANYNGTDPYAGCPIGPYGGWTAPVGNYAANAYGLWDMHGNEWEWCDDWYSAYGGNTTNPTAPEIGSYRMARGGGWDNIAQSCRAACRNYVGPTNYGYKLGFRPVKSAN